MEKSSFPIVIQDGKSVVTFTDENSGVYTTGAKCNSSLQDYLLRVVAGRAKII